MPTMTFPIHPDGLCVPALIGHDHDQLQAIQASGSPLPMPLRVRAIFDTGANFTSVSPSFLTTLGLVSTGSSRTQTASGMASVQFYVISLTVYDPANAGGQTLFRSRWGVTKLPQDLPDMDVIIGINLINQIILHVDGPVGKFSLTF
jgi:hypothetical protein